jgi:hypothetical protein
VSEIPLYPPCDYCGVSEDGTSATADHDVRVCRLSSDLAHHKARAEAAEGERDEAVLDGAVMRGLNEREVSEAIAAMVLCRATASDFGVDLTNPRCPIGAALTRLAADIRAGAWRGEKT